MTDNAPTPGAVLHAESVKLSPAQIDMLERAVREDDGNPFRSYGMRQMAGGAKRRMFNAMQKAGLFDTDNKITDAGRAALESKHFAPDRLAHSTPEGEVDRIVEKRMIDRNRAATLARAGIATTPAQPEPGAGELEVVGYEATGCRPAQFFKTKRDAGWKETRALTDHTQAQAKIARLEGEVARLKEACGFVAEKLMNSEARALSAEADAAKVREAIGLWLADYDDDRRDFQLDDDHAARFRALASQTERRDQ